MRPQAIRARGGAKVNRGEARSNEPVATLHSAAGGDLAVDGRDSSGWRGRVSRAAGFGAARSRLSDHPGDHVLSGRESRCDGVERDGSTRATVRTSAGLAANDVDKF